MTRSVFGMTSHYEMHLGFQKNFRKKLLLLLNYLQHTLHENIYHVDTQFIQMNKYGLEQDIDKFCRVAPEL